MPLRGRKGAGKRETLLYLGFPVRGEGEDALLTLSCLEINKYPWIFYFLGTRVLGPRFHLHSSPQGPAWDGPKFTPRPLLESGGGRWGFSARTNSSISSAMIDKSSRGGMASREVGVGFWLCTTLGGGSFPGFLGQFVPVGPHGRRFSIPLISTERYAYAHAQKPVR